MLCHLRQSEEKRRKTMTEERTISDWLKAQTKLKFIIFTVRQYGGWSIKSLRLTICSYKFVSVSYNNPL